MELNQVKLDQGKLNQEKIDQVKLFQVNLSYDEQTIIDSLDLEICAGEIFVLMGPSGSGKSTLLKGIAGTIAI